MYLKKGQSKCESYYFDYAIINELTICLLLALSYLIYASIIFEIIQDYPQKIFF